MRNSRFGAVVIVMALLFSGCSAVHYDGGTVVKGMTAEQVEKQFGEPDKVDDSPSLAPNTEVWKWGSHTSVQIKNGVVVGVQKSLF